MANRVPLVVGEWYHCYIRGVDKRIVFTSTVDYERFLAYLYVSNGDRNVRLSNLNNTNLHAVLNNEYIERGGPLVEIGAYSLMPNHVHLVLKETHERGIADFAQKIFTGYTKYFNNKYGRTGALFSGTYKSKHIHDDRYLKQVVPYVLLNSVELFEHRWKEGLGDIHSIEKKVFEYPYSNLPDFFGIERPENKIANKTLHAYYDSLPSLTEMIGKAQEYYKEYKPIT